METAELLSAQAATGTYDTQAGILREDSDIYTIVDLDFQEQQEILAKH